VSVAISASVQTAIARRVTAVPRKSWKVSPTIPAAAHALRQDDLKPSAVQGVPRELSRMTGLLLCFAAASSAVFSGAPTGIVTREAEEIPLPLAGPQCQGKRQVQMLRRARVKGRLILGRPDLVGAGRAIWAASFFAGVGWNERAVQPPGQDARQNSPCVISLPARGERKFVPPLQEHPADAPIGERLNGHIPELALDHPDVLGVILARARSELPEVGIVGTW
jgi:hypothetical protein